MDLFGTAGIRGDVAETVTPELGVKVGRSVASEAEESTFVLGYDGRVTSQGLAAAVTAGLTSGGGTVYKVGEVPTPALAYASQGRHGVMITASHNPPEDNGIKLFADGVEYSEEQEHQIETRYKEGVDTATWENWGNTETEEILAEYRTQISQYVIDNVGKVKEITVAVGCGNGMAGHATPQVLSQIGAQPISLNANVDGRFPSRESKPTPESLESFRAFVADRECDLGIAHDGDADRVVVVDQDGEVVHEDTILAILAAWYTGQSTAEDPVVVTTPNASSRVDEQVSEAGGRTERVALGKLHEGISRERADGTDETAIVFAGEPWKHIHPAFGGWIDGVVSAAMITALAGSEGGIKSLTDPVTERPYRKKSVPCPDEKKAKVMHRIEKTISDVFPDGRVKTEYGVRVTLPDESWILIRPSGTEPYIRVYGESESVDALIRRAESLIKEQIAEI